MIKLDAATVSKQRHRKHNMYRYGLSHTQFSRRNNNLHRKYFVKLIGILYPV